MKRCVVNAHGRDDDFIADDIQYVIYNGGTLELTLLNADTSWKATIAYPPTAWLNMHLRMADESEVTEPQERDSNHGR